MNPWIRFARRALMGALFALALLILPCALWSPGEVLRFWHVPLLVLGFVLYIGVLIIETMFFDRYH